jgi:hypothetical protein
MSRYQVDKILRECVMSEDALAAFVADPQAYVAGRDLTEAERAALVASDYPTLYTAGAHPFLLQVFAIAQWPPSEMMPRWVAYTKALEGRGYPDFST